MHLRDIKKLDKIFNCAMLKINSKLKNNIIMKRLSFPIDVQIELTEACNQKCRHCYNFWRYDSEVVKKNELSAADFLLVLDKLNDCGVSVITITGGEPMLRPEVFFSLLRKAKRYDMEVGLNSNAVLISKEIAHRMFEEKLDHALISLLGVKDTHNLIAGLPGGFEKTRNGIINLIEAGVPVSVNMVASKMNQNEIYEVGRMVKELGVESFCMTPMVPSHKSNLQYLLSKEECKNSLRELMRVQRDFCLEIDTLEPIPRCLFKEEEDEEFLPFLGNRICSAAISSCAISSKGNVRPCVQSDKEFGSLLFEDFSEVWERMKFWSSCDILPKECQKCNANIICEGGCRMSGKMVNGSYDSNDMYMTEPIMDFGRIQKLPERETIVLHKNDPLKINKQLRFRKENFGWIIYSHRKVEFCTEEGFNLIKQLCDKPYFTIENLMEEFSFSEDLIKPIIIKFLENKLILKIN